ncbi:MAG: hypothetical protein IT539_00525 [Bradyrhizobiaceae bacterium]|nr:hypothetical protein [Bradyrhizobiaceae bacterium]
MAGRATSIRLAEERVSAPPIDLAVLEQATLGDPALAREVLSLFSGHAEKLLAEIAGTSDARMRREAAHGLKGAALGIGATAVAEAAAALEAVAGDREKFPGALAHLSTLVAVARLAIAGLLLRN